MREVGVPHATLIQVEVTPDFTNTSQYIIGIR